MRWKVRWCSWTSFFVLFVHFKFVFSSLRKLQIQTIWNIKKTDSSWDRMKKKEMTIWNWKARQETIWLCFIRDNWAIMIEQFLLFCFLLLTTCSWLNYNKLNSWFSSMSSKISRVRSPERTFSRKVRVFEFCVTHKKGFYDG